MRVIALAPLTGAGERPPTSVAELAADALVLVRADQHSGPYRLLGYSFGGMIALELARLLQNSGEQVSFVGLVDTIFDPRYWPFRLFVGALARRVGTHAKGLLSKPPGAAWRELRDRAGRLARRLARRFSTAADEAPGAGQASGGGEDGELSNLAIMSRWQPTVFEGPAILFTAHDSDFGCDLATLWRPWLPHARTEHIPGAHVDLVREPFAIGLLAGAVRRALGGSDNPAPRGLVAATFRWSSAARLAVELHAAGWVVEAVAPSGSALRKVNAVERSFGLSLLRPLGSMKRALAASSADFILPFDDRTRQVLHRVYAELDDSTESNARIRRLIVRSLGSAGAYSQLYSRAAVMALAAEHAVRCPDTAPVGSVADVTAWRAAHPAPAVLKTDGSWGGREIAIINRAADVAPAWRGLSRPPGFARCSKRLLVERDPWPMRAWITRRHPELSIQTYVDGRPGNIAVACLDGEVLAAVPVEVIRSNGPTGPSTVVRVLAKSEMVDMARTLVAALGLSGLCGFDFVLESGTGRPFLIELNPRATPTSHLRSADGGDLLAVLGAALRPGSGTTRTSGCSGGVIALFPQELRRDSASPLLTSTCHDVPWHAPDLVELALSEVGARSRARVRPPHQATGGTPVGGPVPAPPA